ncbi:MAG: hypothetical protein HYY14_00030 [Candidatus Omnitrophica bacterium]|nr:hypothetical protein [Candidatus Omnitrophota bacterium]
MSVEEREGEVPEWSEADIPRRFRDDYSEPAQGKKRCPSCQNEIPEEAVRCLFCGRHVPVAAGFLSSMGRYPFRIIAVAGALLALAGVLTWLL